MRIVDRALRIVGLARLSSFRMKASYAGASVGRLFRDWVAGILHPDAEVEQSISALRARARDLVRNNEYAAGFVCELANNVVGPDGIMLQARVQAASGERDRETNLAIEAAWGEWMFPENASADGHDSWTDIERLAIQTVAIDGEAFIRHRRGYAASGFRYAVQFIDADLLDEGFNRAPDEDGVRIRMGIEMNEDGRPLAYHFFKRHPNDRWVGASRERVRIAADEIVHLFVRYRPNQSRGVTWFAPVLTKVKMLDGYEEAELTATRVAAAKMGFIVNKNEAAIAAFMPPDDGDAGNRTFEVAPGLIPELLPGQEFQPFDPTHPSAAFRDFTQTVLRGIARGLGISYTTLTGDLTNANYSSSRVGLLAERDHYRTLQRWLAVNLHRRVYREWIEFALLAGRVPGLRSRSFEPRFLAVEWKPRGWAWVDPENDLKAAEREVRLGINSRSRLAAERGRDFEEVVDELADEQEYAERVGVDVSGTDGQHDAGEPEPGRRDGDPESTRAALAAV